uniref:Uncharacterized protein n=1 Tax=Anguilla anguilla TaxID=7936 RepID=A0A0E9WV25_ANGAN
MESQWTSFLYACSLSPSQVDAQPVERKQVITSPWQTTDVCPPCQNWQDVHYEESVQMAMKERLSLPGKLWSFSHSHKYLNP